MGRPFIFFADSKSPSPRSDVGAGPSYSTPQSPQRSNTRATLVADAESAALQIIELCGLLNDHYGLARASYTEFSSCRAALLVILAQSLNEQTETLRSALATGMKLIRRMAVSIDSVKSEVSVIEALETAIKRLDMGGDARRGGNDKEKENGYEKFRSWAALWKGGVSDQGESTLAGSQIPPQTFPDTPFLWTSTSFGQNVSVGQLSPDSVTVENQLIDFGLGNMAGPFPALDDQWQVDFGTLNGFDSGMSFNE